jgi:hypothetical protein
MSRMTPEMRARLEAFKAVKVKHPRLEEVDRTVMRAIDEHASYTQLLLYGPTGAGKSTVAKHITERYLTAEPNRAIVPVVLVEAHSSDIGAYARLDYYGQVLAQLRNHAAVKDRLMHVALSEQRPGRQLRDAAEWLNMREAVIYALERLHVRAIFIDEAQHLMRVDPPFKPVDQLDWLKGITNRTNVLHVLVGNYDLYDFRNLSGQAARRGRDLHFPRYRLDAQVECEEFAGALRYLLERVPLSCDLDDLLSYWRWFAEWSIGCVGILRDWVVDTVAALCEEGGTSLTIQALEHYALQPDQRVRLEMEARAGEHKVEEGKARSQQQLEELLRHATKTPQTPFHLDGSRGAQAVTASTNRSNAPLPKMPKGSKIERAPQRDRVGEAVEVQNTTRCLFSGSMIDVPARAMRDAGVLRVECPECLTMRGLTPQGETVRFPPHDQRKTRTPHSEARWVRREGTWELAGQ